MFEIHDDPILANETRMWQDNEPVLSSSLRPNSGTRSSDIWELPRLPHLRASHAKIAITFASSMEERRGTCSTVLKSQRCARLGSGCEGAWAFS